MAKAVLTCKVRIEQMENKRLVKQIFEWNLSESLWEKICLGHAKLKLNDCIFNVPASCVPSPKPAPCSVTVEDQQLRYFLQKDDYFI
ncbi:hypothetical protein FHG87_011344 [Trinorchestia longiramus]|nr:hypothetical protein FHG87_011344 [Trinorchestia longiramus]